MSQRPTADELIEAAMEFLEVEVVPVLDDPRLAFRVRVALNALRIARRDLCSDVENALTEEELRDLAARIRSGGTRAVPIGTLKQHVAAELQRSSPGYGKRIQP